MSDLEVHVVPKDLYYHEVAYVRKLEAENKRLRADLDRIAKQPLKSELEQDEEGDFEFAYDEIIKWARDAFKAVTPPISDLGRAVRQARLEATGKEEPPTPKQGFA